MTDITFYNMGRTETSEGRAALLAPMKDEEPALAPTARFAALTVLERAEDGRVHVEGRWQSKDAFDAAVADDPVAQKSRVRLPSSFRPSPACSRRCFIFSPTATPVRELGYLQE
ncbi:MAG: hypothetical protein WBV28_20285 [Terracidiphilus sp.]